MYQKPITDRSDVIMATNQMRCIPNPKQFNPNILLIVCSSFYLVLMLIRRLYTSPSITSKPLDLIQRLYLKHLSELSSMPATNATAKPKARATGEKTPQSQPQPMPLKQKK
jgi:hypothetical protein